MYYLPKDNNGSIFFDEGQIINLSCPGSSVVVDSANTNNVTATIACVAYTLFSIQGTIVPFTAFTCKRWPRHTARYTGKTCGVNYKEIEIGFQLETSFIPHIISCFDEVNRNPIYTWFNLTKAIGGFQRGFGRSHLLHGSFYNLPPGKFMSLYKREVQRATINKLVGLAEYDLKYIKESFFLNKGHLSAKADFVFGAIHRLTFWSVNIVPQWRSVNGGNWNALEQNVRRYASHNGLDLAVYTGTFGVATLPHETTGEMTQLYLYVDENNNKGLPVPAILWKLVYDPKSQAGIVFISVNNPYQEEKEALCTDVSDEVSWLTWKKDEKAKGYSYACRADEFAKIVEYLPNVQIRGLLT